jgi:hypothetical protein
MTTQTNNNPSSNDRKKRRADDSIIISDDVQSTVTNKADNSFPTFIVVEAVSGEIKLSVFALQKLLEMSVGSVKNAKKLRNGSVLIEVVSKNQADRALSMKSWVDPNDTSKHIPLKVTPHRSLNSSRGVIRCRDLRDCSEEEVLEALVHEGVTAVKHIYTKRNGTSLPTNTFILTFNKPCPPKSVKAAYYNIPVEPYVPSPLRCFNCQKYGHGQSSCSHKSVCARCGLEGHKDTDCSELQPKCANCSGDHPAYSRQCPEWNKQQAIVQIKTERNVSFNEAKHIYSQQSSSVSTGQTGGTYASVVKSTKSVSTQTDLTWPNDSVTAKACDTPSSVTVKKTTDTQTSTEDISHLGAVSGSCSAKLTTSCHGSLSNIPHYMSSTPKQQVQNNIQKPGPASSKPGLGNKPAKGSKDTISLYNRFGSLDSMDVELSPGKGPGGRKNR